jgi:hypothetical protein
MGWFSEMSAIWAKDFRSELYELLFDRQVQQRIEREFPDLIREEHDHLSRMYDFDDAGEARAAALAGVAQYLAEECLDTALRLNGWGPTEGRYRLGKRQGYGMLYVGYKAHGPLEYDRYYRGGITIYKKESIEAYIWWRTTFAASLSDASATNATVASALQSIESEFRGKGWSYQRL